MSDQERCPTGCANHDKSVCPWHNYSAPRSVAEQPHIGPNTIRTPDGGLATLGIAGGEYKEQPSREQAVEGLVIDIETARLINGAFLPTNPNKMRSACPEVIQAAKKFKDALAQYEASRGERQ